MAPCIHRNYLYLLYFFHFTVDKVDPIFQNLHMIIAKSLSIVALSLLFSLSAQAELICLDPGHGGQDPGAIGCGLHEADVVLDTQLRLRDLLIAAGHSVIMTRDSDVYLTLTARTDYANSNGADLFVSIHANSADAVNATGTETYCYTNGSSRSVDMRDRIQAEMILAWDLADRGGKEANFSVLRNSSMPATLSELGFISNCSIDALLLADGDSRQQAAQAHLAAIQEHLGVEPGELPGYIRGVVFEDQGSGTDDMSIRLPSALLEVLGQNEQSNADAPEGAWSFLLPSGDYTIRASLTGYLSAERNCSVVSAGTTWCSIGLVRDSESASDAGVQNRDATLNVDTRRDDAATMITDAQTGMDNMIIQDARGDYDTSDSEAHSDLDAHSAGVDANSEKNSAEPGGCDCQAHNQGDSQGALIAMLLAFVLLFARRKKWIGQFVSMLMLLDLSQQVQAQQIQAKQNKTDVVTVAVSQNAPLHILAIDTLAAVGMTAPLLSPRGDHILFAPKNLAAIYLQELGQNEAHAQLLIRRRGAGLDPLWSRDGQSFGLRPSTAPFSGQWLEQYSLNGRFMGPMTTTSGLYVGQDQDRIILFAHKKRQIIADASDGDRFYAPMLSPDAQWLSYRGLQQGLFVYRLADGQKFLLGQGDHARFSEDGRFLLYERSHDDGEKLLSSQLFISDLQDPNLHSTRIKTPAGLAQYPSLSVQSQRLAFVLNGKILIARVHIKRK